MNAFHFCINLRMGRLNAVDDCRALAERRERSKILTTQSPGPLQITEGHYLRMLDAGSVVRHKPRFL